MDKQPPSLEYLRESLRVQIRESRSSISGLSKTAFHVIKETLETLENTLRDELEKIDVKMETVMQSMDSRAVEIEKYLQRIAAVEEQLARNRQALEAKITLDIGGQTFSCPKELLLKHPNSYFSLMLCSGHWKPDASGRFYVDRSPKHFSAILEFLRTGYLDTEHMTQREKEELHKEMEYYQMIADNVAVQHLPPFRWVRIHENQLKTKANWVFGTKKENQKSPGLRGSNPINYFKLKILQPEVGIALTSYDGPDFVAPTNESLYWYSNGFQVSPSETIVRPGAKEGDIVEGFLDFKRSFRLMVNGINQVCNFQNLPDNPLYTAILLGDGAGVEIIEP
jgi:hypothetical protein